MLCLYSETQSLRVGKKDSETELIPRFDIGVVHVHNTKA